MKRIGYLIVVLAAVVCMEGCKRGASEKRPPAQVQVEKDFIIAKSSTAFVNALKPEAKADAEPNNEAEHQARQKKEDANQKLQDQNEKLKRKDDVAKVGQAFLAFCGTNLPKDQSLDKFKSYLRRAGLADLRAEVDGGQVEIVFLALLNAPNHIVAYSKETNSGDSDAFEVGAPNFPKHPGMTLKTADLTERIQRQELAAIYRHVWEFSMPYYVNMPSDAPGAMNLKNRLNTGLPRDALAAVRAQAPQLIKNPPEQRDLEKFKRYLKENASPDTLTALEGKFRVNPSADFNSPDDLVVCRGTPEVQKGHLAITSLGTINYYSSEVINQRFQQK